MKYRVALQFAKVTELLSAPTLPDYSKVLILDKELRLIEGDTPSWLHLPHAAVDSEQESESRMTPQRHQAVLLIHKGLLGESELDNANDSPTPSVVLPSYHRRSGTDSLPFCNIVYRLCALSEETYRDPAVDPGKVPNSSIWMVVLPL
jgi:hypothetical protein